MKKCAIVSVFIISLAFSSGIKPGFDIGFGWQHLSWDREFYGGESYNLSALGFQVGTTLPYSPYVGLYAEIFGLRFWNQEEYDENLTEINIGGRAELYGMFGIGGQIGLIEMIPRRSVSPYFRQHFLLLNYSEDGYSSTHLGFGLGFGVEFVSSSQVSPFLEGSFTYGSLDLYETIGMIGFSVRGGVRLKLKR